MSVPDVVQSALGDEQVAAQVGLGGEDELYVTPTRILIYRGEGLLSDESVETHPHRAERVVVRQGRRKAKIVLQHDLEGERAFSVPPDRVDDVVHPVLAGVLNAADVTEPGETVKQTYRFSELTLIVTSRRLVKHIGEAVWDVEYEEYRFEDTTGLSFEEGRVATQIVMEVDGRRERIKAPNEEAPEVRAHLEEALFDFYGVSDRAEFEAEVAESAGDPGETPDAAETAGEDEVAFAGGVSPLDAGGGDPGEDVGGASAGGGNSPGDGAAGAAGDAFDAVGDLTGGGADALGSEEPAGAGDAAAGSGAPAVDDATVDAGEGSLDAGDIGERLDEIARAVNKQNQLLKRHQETMQRLVDELQRMHD